MGLYEMDFDFTSQDNTPKTRVEYILKLIRENYSSKI